MSGTILHLEPDAHGAVQTLLPWYLTGRLSPSERLEVESHLESCPECRAELESERQLQLAQPDSCTTLDVDAGWQKMQLSIAGTPVPRQPARRGDRRTMRPDRRAQPGIWQLLARPAVRAWAAPALLSLVLSAVLLQTQFAAPKLSADYLALAAPAADMATAVVRFRAEATEQQIRHSLNDSGARLVDGPTVTDAYVVRLPRQRYAASLEKLRKDPAVSLVEALESAPSP